MNGCESLRTAFADLLKTGGHSASHTVKNVGFRFRQLFVCGVGQHSVFYGLLGHIFAIYGEINEGVRGWVDQGFQLGDGGFAGCAGDDQNWGRLIWEHGLGHPVGELVGIVE